MNNQNPAPAPGNPGQKKGPIIRVIKVHKKYNVSPNEALKAQNQNLPKIVVKNVKASILQNMTITTPLILSSQNTSLACPSSMTPTLVKPTNMQTTPVKLPTNPSQLILHQANPS